MMVLSSEEEGRSIGEKHRNNDGNYKLLALQLPTERKRKLPHSQIIHKAMWECPLKIIRF
jgi:hypothetical protein